MSKTTKKTTMRAITEESSSADNRPLNSNDNYMGSAGKPPCDWGQDAFIPYWEKIDGDIVYGCDHYTICSVAGCGEIWYCRVKDEKNNKSGCLQPNVDVFFTKKEAERKISGLKKTEDVKKLAKWRRKDVENIGIR